MHHECATAVTSEVDGGVKVEPHQSIRELVQIEPLAAGLSVRGNMVRMGRGIGELNRK